MSAAAAIESEKFRRKAHSAPGAAAEGKAREKRSVHRFAAKHFAPCRKNRSDSCAKSTAVRNAG
jgi:hypothetical protein